MRKLLDNQVIPYLICKMISAVEVNLRLIAFRNVSYLILYDAPYHQYRQVETTRIVGLNQTKSMAIFDSKSILKRHSQFSMNIHDLSAPPTHAYVLIEFFLRKLYFFL